MPKRDGSGSDPTGLSPRRQQPTALAQLKSLLTRKGLRRPLKLTEDHLLSLLFLRRARDAVLGQDLFSDPAWDVLLELYAAKLGGRSMSVADLAQAVATPRSTTARWIAALEERGLITSAIDPSEPDRLQVELTAEGASKMEHLGNHWGSAFVSI